jgi:hypothetical protein
LFLLVSRVLAQVSAAKQSQLVAAAAEGPAPAAATVVAAPVLERMVYTQTTAGQPSFDWQRVTRLPNSTPLVLDWPADTMDTSNTTLPAAVASSPRGRKTARPGRVAASAVTQFFKA